MSRAEKGAKEDGGFFSNWKVGVLAVLIIATLGTAWSVYRKYTAPLRMENVPGNPFGRPDAGDIYGALKELDVSTGQMVKFARLAAKGEPQSAEEREARRREFEAVLTPEQRTKIQEMIAQRMGEMRQRAQEKMSPQNFEAVERRWEERMKQNPERARWMSGAAPSPAAPAPPAAATQ